HRLPHPPLVLASLAAVLRLGLLGLAILRRRLDLLAPPEGVVAAAALRARPLPCRFVHPCLTSSCRRNAPPVDFRRRPSAAVSTRRGTAVVRRGTAAASVIPAPVIDGPSADADELADLVAGPLAGGGGASLQFGACHLHRPGVRRPLADLTLGRVALEFVER